MRKQGGVHKSYAFTLIELLVVIAIIGILASLLLPALSRAKIAAKVASAKMDIGGIKTAVTQYQAEYSRLPASSQAATKAGQFNGDFTYGTVVSSSGTSTNVSNDYTVHSPYGSKWENCNAEIMNILTANTTPNPNASFAMLNVNANPPNKYNPRNHAFFNGKVANNTALVSDTPGLDYNGIMRDPFGNPYIITIDLNYDNQCNDFIYSPLYQKFGFAQTNIPGQVVVWSAGPDKSIDYTGNVSPTQGVNKDNIISW